jgi:hypothetical protein
MNITNPELMKSKELRKIIRESITEVLDEGNKLFALKNQADSSKGLPSTIDPDDATEKSSAFTAKYKPVSESDIDELARKAKGYRLADDNIDTTPFATKNISGVNMADVINYFRENPGAEKTGLQSNFNFKRPQIANAIVNALRDAGVLVKLGAEGEPEIGGDAPTSVTATDAEDMFVGGAENPLSMYFDGEQNADGSEDFEQEPEAGEIEKAEPVNTSNVSDADMDASYKYTELERRLAAAKSNILKIRKSKPGAGDIKDVPSDELQRLRDLKISLEKRIADLKASSAYVRKLSGTPEPEDIEMPDTEDEESLAEYQMRRLQYYAGIIK